jgi:hypothetical protein
LLLTRFRLVLRAGGVFADVVSLGALPVLETWWAAWSGL